MLFWSDITMLIMVFYDNTIVLFCGSITVVMFWIIYMVIYIG